MKTLHINLEDRGYDIHIQSGILSEAGKHCTTVLPKAKQLALVSDSNVAPLYADTVMDSLTKAGFSVQLTVLPAGESTKSLDCLGQLYDAFMAQGLTRTDAVVALGGGVIGDLAGFAASTILRGVDFIQIPTTLLAQVDSSVGGKVAIDLPAGKNLAGAFWQPKLVLMDPDVLDSLPDVVFYEGMAEVLKYGCIFDAEFFGFLVKRLTRAQIMADIVGVLYTCCDWKRKVVVEDERDTGARMLLNFGHTVGHAYELAGGYTTWSHGAAVAAGMCKAAELGVKLGFSSYQIWEEITQACTALGLPTSIPCTMEDYRAAIGLDKKGAGNSITLILLEEMGKATPCKLSKAYVLSLLAQEESQL